MNDDKIAEETFKSFFCNFNDDAHTKIVLETFFEILYGETVPLHSTSGQVGNESDKSIPIQPLPTNQDNEGGGS